MRLHVPRFPPSPVIIPNLLSSAPWTCLMWVIDYTENLTVLFFKPAGDEKQQFGRQSVKIKNRFKRNKFLAMVQTKRSSLWTTHEQKSFINSHNYSFIHLFFYSFILIQVLGHPRDPNAASFFPPNDQKAEVWGSCKAQKERSYCRKKYECYKHLSWSDDQC